MGDFYVRLAPVSIAALTLALASCAPKPDVNATSEPQVSPVKLEKIVTEPLPLRVSYLDLMTGVIGASAFPLFELSGSKRPLTASEWVRVGSAATKLVAMSTLLSMEGAAPEDQRRFDDPEWINLVNAFRDASLSVTAAADQNDRDAFASAAIAVGQSCQTCHAKFAKKPASRNPDLASARQPAN